MLTILIGLGLVFVWQIRGTLMLTFAAVILVVLFTMPVRLLTDRFRLHRVVAILVSVFGFFIIIGLLGVPILRTIGDQYEPLRTAVEGGLEQVRQSLTPEALLEQNSFLIDVIPIINDLLAGGDNAQPSDDLIGQAVSQVTDAVGRLGGSVLPVVGGVANTILSVLIIFFLSMYLLAEPDLYVNGIIKLTPIWYRERMLSILKRLDSTLPRLAERHGCIDGGGGDPDRTGLAAGGHPGRSLRPWACWRGSCPSYQTSVPWWRWCHQSR